MNYSGFLEQAGNSPYIFSTSTSHNVNKSAIKTNIAFVKLSA